jgi:hypothetical protein
MMRRNRTLSLVAVAAAAGWLAAAVPAGAAPRQGGGRPTSSRPPSGGGGGAARPSGGSGGSTNTGSGGGQPAPRAVPRDSGGSNRGSNGSGGDGATSGTSSRPTSSRPPTAGVPAGRAGEPRTSVRRVIVPQGYYGGFYPWGYAGLGFGGYYAGYYGYYDPWLYDPYYAPAYIPVADDEGTLRLKVKPRDAMVYVDGYYAGRVDDFDGVFQRLHIDPGAHTIEVRADGYEPLTFNIDVRRYRSTTYSGTLKKIE